uniref:Uncharacterized protein n=1 Tax=Romanomermis culicivorax TaxID=13658 RepID=A0A915L3Y9_ROMCU
MYLYGLTLNKTISQQLDFYSGINIMNAAKFTTFDGAVGPVTINNNSEKVPKYKAGQLQVRNSTITYFMQLGPNSNSSNAYSIEDEKVIFMQVHYCHWPSNYLMKKDAYC